ncbi:hypothetical protein HHI36_018398 [Cryptolaemus montrouzieri]|uniref:Uncharacterized protein n=1 Tax=Cryptolaemus montrouzieri TaxID=559131 RepID=A0ABD2P099_9CUCU
MYVVLGKLSNNLVAYSDQNNIILENDLNEVNVQKVSLLAVEELIQKSVKYQYQMILNDNIALKSALEKQYHAIKTDIINLRESNKDLIRMLFTKQQVLSNSNKPQKPVKLNLTSNKKSYADATINNISPPILEKEDNVVNAAYADTERELRNNKHNPTLSLPIVNQNTENCNNKQPFNNFEIPVVPEVTSINSESKFEVVSYKKKRKPEILENQKHSSLKADAKLESVYISRIDPSSTVESFENHLKKNGIEQYQVKIGFSKQPDVYKSFVTTPQYVLDKVKKPEL